MVSKLINLMKLVDAKLKSLEKDIEYVCIHINALIDDVTLLIMLPLRMKEFTRHNEEVMQMLRDILHIFVLASHHPNKDKEATNT